MATKGLGFVVVTVVAVVAVAVVTPAPATAAPTRNAEPIVYQPPVDAAIVDPFRPPDNPYGRGNRGLTYDLAPGTAVRASADGTVSFAGTVANTRHVTVAHADGLRSSYSFLTTVSVGRGERVAAGDIVGYAGSGFHFGIREGETYLDPAALFGELEVRVRLIPHDPPPPTPGQVAMDRRALRAVVADVGVGSVVTDAVGDVVEHGPVILEATIDQLYESTRIKALTLVDLSRRYNPAVVVDKAVQFVGNLRRECTEAGTPVAVPSVEPRVAVTVAGYGSNSSSAAVDDIDTSALGYADTDVLRYSYLGGRVPGEVAEDLSGIAQHEYQPADTSTDLRLRGLELADLIADAAAGRPGAPVDVYAHSQGGIVTRIALLELEERGLIDRLGVVVTIGTPHGGADLASAGVALSPLGDWSIHRAAEFFGAHVDPDAVSVRQMAEFSHLQGELSASGVPEGLDFRTVGARGDLVVPATRTTVPGTPGAIVDLVGPSAHDSLPGDPATTRELVLALAGKPTGCESVLDSLLDTAVPEVVTAIEDLVTLAVPSL